VRHQNLLPRTISDTNSPSRFGSILQLPENATRSVSLGASSPAGSWRSRGLFRRLSADAQSATTQGDPSDSPAKRASSDSDGSPMTFFQSAAAPEPLCENPNGPSSYWCATAHTARTDGQIEKRLP